MTDETSMRIPIAGPSISLAADAMACEFGITLNLEDRERLWIASDALAMVHGIEDRLTVYRHSSELISLNQSAFDRPIRVADDMFSLLARAMSLAELTDGAFDPTSGPLISLWRSCKKAGRTPSDAELKAARERCGYQHVLLDAATKSVAFNIGGLEINLGGVGKGWAIDCLGSALDEGELTHWAIHGGRSSILARGTNGNEHGWTISLQNPLFPKELLATLVLQNEAMSTSGSGVQFFRHQGKRYGHILDPRSGEAVEGMLSTTVFAADAATADALSTAFFVMGLEKARSFCENFPSQSGSVGAILVPHPTRGRRLEPVVVNVPSSRIFWNPKAVSGA